MSMYIKVYKLLELVNIYYYYYNAVVIIYLKGR
jgi:hypothetical protein